MKRAILIADMAGFSSLCEAEGIEAGLAAVEAFRGVGRAAVAGRGGTWVKAWADNFAAVFATLTAARECAEDLAVLTGCSCGIGWGEVILDRPPGDLWGVEVNRASRLGEDVAERGQVLLTEAAQAAS